MSKLNDIIFTPKWKDIIRDQSRVIFLEGPTGTGKSLLCSLKVYFDMMTLPEGQNTGILVGESATTLERIFVNNSMSLVNLFPNAQYKKQGVGGSRLEIQAKGELKILYLVGASNKSSWGKALGLTAHYFFLDEGNRIHEDFLSEIFVRLYRNQGKMVVTSNGDNPDIPFYTEYMNKCTPVEKYIDNIPQSTIQYMNDRDSEDSYNYYHLGFTDNPKNTQQDIDDLHNSVAVGSFRYITKVLGERGTSTGAVFANSITENNFIPYSEVPHDKIVRIEIGVDLGKNAKTVLSATGFNPKHFNKFYSLRTIDSSAKTSDGLLNDIVQFVNGIQEKYGMKVRFIWIDDGLEFLVNSIASYFKRHNIKIGYSKKPRIDQRTMLLTDLLFSDDWLFVDTLDNRNTVKMLNRILTDGSNGRIDNNDPWNDYVDAMDYTYTAYMKSIQAIRTRRRI